jgi:pSer/pThr/pTyr-binding forkhead associated (FHA) protein
MTSVKVAVRVRPFNTREKSMSSKCVIEMKDNMTKITDPASGKEKKFYFDYSYWSHDGYAEDPSSGVLLPDGPSSIYASQQKVFDDLGIDVLNNAWEGYHTCLFAYGQTGSGKSYSIVGYGKNEGIIPMACKEIFRRIDEAQAKPSNKLVFEVTVSMLEIYNEKVQDLFMNPNKRQKGGLKVREDKGEVFVEGLSKIPVNSYEDIDEQINLGTSNRTIGSTQMNATSSRAHTVTTITFKQTVYENGKPTNQKRSDINLVDLAGSERQSGTGATGDRLKEGSNINKSLSFLGKCITILAERSTGKGKNSVVPYRESQLTRILQNALGGNSKTSMIAALSPASINYEETLSTLRYANQVKAIKNEAKINESAHDKLIRELREENEKLKQMIDRKAELHEMNPIAPASYSNKCYIFNVNEDPFLTGQVKHILEEGSNVIGKSTKDFTPDIRIGGIGVSPEHCELVYDKSTKSVQLKPNKSDPSKYKCILNGQEVDRKIQVAHGDKLLFGNHNLFVVVFPDQEVTEEMKDYESIMKSMNRDAIEAFTDSATDHDTNKQLEEMRRKMEEESKAVQDKLKIEQKKLMDEKKRLAKKAEAEHKKLLEEYKAQAKDSEERVKLQEQIRKQQEEAEKFRKEQKKKEKEFEMEKKKALQEIELKKREDHKKEVEILERKNLEQKLSKLIPQINEVNEICQNLGRYTYNYIPHILTEVLPDGRRMPKLVVKAYPDREKEFYNILNFEEFEDKMYMIREKWENMQFDIENGDPNAEIELEPDEREGEIFGLSVQNQDKLIGTVYIF